MMWFTSIRRDLLLVLPLFLGCMTLGLILNAGRSSKLRLIYLSPQARLNLVVQRDGAKVSFPSGLGIDVAKKEMREISENRSALILDARPKTFFTMGHIPSALSLPRNDFEKSYQAALPTLHAYRNKPIVVYCSDTGCPDSHLVAQALHQLGYANVRVFPGGWDEWIDADLPSGQGCHCGD